MMEDQGEYQLEYEIGNSYWVPCLKVESMPKHLAWIPVQGRPHWDKEIIGFPDEHYHPDPRFMTAAQLWRWGITPLGVYLLPTTTSLVRPVNINPSYASDSIALSREPTLKRRTCYRTMPAFPWAHAPYIGKLTSAYAGCRIDPERPVCPHRGFDLRGAPVVDGAIVCPGHGLRWDARTGEIVRAEKS